MKNDKKIIVLGLVFALLVFGTVISSNADQVLGPAANYNVFVLGNLNGHNADVEGNLAVGGNMTTTVYGVGHRNRGFYDAALVVGGDAKLGTGELQNGNLYYGGSYTNTGGFNVQGGTINKYSAANAPIDFAAAAAYFGDLSSSWGALDATAGSSAKNQWSKLTINAGAGVDGLAVVNMSVTDFLNAWTTEIIAAAGTTVLINVFGDSAIIQGQTQYSGGVTASNVMFNFVDATSLTFQQIGFSANMIAVNATATITQGQMDGQFIFGNLNQPGTGEFHNNINFNGDLPIPPNVDPEDPSATPEPATLLILGLGMLGTGFVARRRKTA